MAHISRKARRCNCIQNGTCCSVMSSESCPPSLTSAFVSLPGRCSPPCTHVASSSSRQTLHQLKYLRASLCPKVFSQTPGFYLRPTWVTWPSIADSPSACSELRVKVGTCAKNRRGVLSPKKYWGGGLLEGEWTLNHWSNNCSSYPCLHRWAHIISLAWSPFLPKLPTTFLPFFLPEVKIPPPTPKKSSRSQQPILSSSFQLQRIIVHACHLQLAKVN